MTEVMAKARELLTALGLTLEPDDGLLVVLVSGATDYACAQTNQKVLPDGLVTATAYLAVGQYLQAVKTTGKLSGLHIDAAVKQIQEGDTSVTYAIGAGDATPEQRLDRLIDWLSDYGLRLYGAYRRMRW